MKPSMLQLDEARMSGARLVDPKSIMSRYQTLKGKEVLNPPHIWEYNDKAISPNYTKTTHNLTVSYSQATALYNPTLKVFISTHNTLQLCICAGPPSSPPYHTLHLYLCGSPIKSPLSDALTSTFAGISGPTVEAASRDPSEGP
jgi:hypothetical protein